MKLEWYIRGVLAMALCGAGLYAQTVASALQGVVVDPADAAVAGAGVTLTNTDTGATRTAATDNTGTYRFPNIDAGNYNLTVKASGFKAETQTGIVVAAQETHNGGKMVLQLGSVSESISVTAEAAQIQLSSSEQSSTVDTADLEDLTLKGRDLFGYMKLVPGIIDNNSQSRDVTSPNQLRGFSIQGNSTVTMNFTVDGITDMDTGSNSTLHYEPNMDAVQELRVLTSNYQAEYGRNSGGTITVVTKNGTQQFHGSGNWSYRHEDFNANSWADNHTIKNIGGINQATPRPLYRYDIETYSIGGPMYIPKLVNKDKKRLFFFWSQEFTGQYVPGGTETNYVPTALERQGNFSQSFGNSNGNPVTIQILDPANNNQPFAGNIIPPNRINALGQNFLNFFPLPNYTPTIPNQLYVDNFFEQGSAQHPRRNDVARIDTYITSKISAYARWIHDHDDMTDLYQGVFWDQYAQNGRVEPGGTPPPISPIDHPNPGHSWSGTLTYTITPTLINEVTVAESWNTWSYYTLDDYADESRNLIPGIPTLFPIPPTSASGSQGPVNGYENILPTFTFSGLLPSNSAYNRGPGTNSGTYENFNPIWSYQDNISKVIGHHALKAGFYLEKNNKIQPASDNYAGAYQFNASTSIPQIDTNSGYALALLGIASQYSQATDTVTFNTEYWNKEFYVQDNWKVNRRLTMDLGMRIYSQTPQYDLNNTFVNFEIKQYNPAAAPRLYQPACNQAIATGPINPNNGLKTCTSASNGLIAYDPVTGNSVGSGFIQDTVPGSGNYTDGSVVLGQNGVDKDPYHQTPAAIAPRIGFAYDLFGDGKTAVRGGWGMFYDRLMGNDVYALSGQPPVAFTQTVTNVTFAQIQAQNTGAAPNVNSLSLPANSPSQSYPYTGISKLPRDGVQTASLDIQHNLGRSTVIDIGYTFDYGFDQPTQYDLNWVPVGTGWPFTPSNLNPTTGGSTSSDIGTNYERFRFPGLGNVNGWGWFGHTNYNGLNFSANRRLSHGLILGANYTYSKSLGTLAYTPTATGQNGLPTNEQWNYGRQSFDRTHNLVLSYSYDIPGIAKALHARGLGYVTDHWTFSGITTVQSGAPFNPGCGFVSGSPSPNGGGNAYTGTPDMGQRCDVIGNPYANLPTNPNGQVYFNPSAYAMATVNFTGPNHSLVGPPVLGNLGGGSGELSLPRYTNFDMTLSKIFPLGSEKRIIRLQAQAYNVFNHTEISGINTGINFNFTTNAVTNPTTLGYLNATLPARIMAFTARFEF